MVLLLHWKDDVQSLDPHGKLLSSSHHHVVGSITPWAHPVVPYIHLYSSDHYLIIRQEPSDLGLSVLLRELFVIHTTGGLCPQSEHFSAGLATFFDLITEEKRHEPILTVEIGGILLNAYVCQGPS